MSPVLEAKWREFNESNPYNRDKDTSEEDAKTATEGGHFVAYQTEAKTLRKWPSLVIIIIYSLCYPGSVRWQHF